MTLEKVHRSQIMKDKKRGDEECGLYPMKSVVGDRWKSDWLYGIDGRIRDCRQENS